MAVLSVITDDDRKSVTFVPGDTVAEILDAAGIHLRYACGRVGRCGLCLVRVIDGTLNRPAEIERARLSSEQLNNGFRLACQARPSGDALIKIEVPGLQVVWKEITEYEYGCAFHYANAGTISAGSDDALGLAVDLGTTHIRVSLIDVTTGRMLASRSGLNPQAMFGADVLTRLSAASGSKDLAVEISGLARTAIGEALRDIVANSLLDIHRIGRVVVVGNTAMLTLLAGKNYSLLLDPVNWMRSIDCLPEDPVFLSKAWGIGESASIEVIQPLAGFIGSDILAGVIATRLAEGTGPALLIDFGTNSEIALWDGKTLCVTSASGGPAFEGSGLSSGMPAEQGAVFRVTMEESFQRFNCEVIGGGEAKGICSTGLTDAMACMLRSGMLSSVGRFTMKADEIILCKGKMDIRLKEKDVDLFQRAKAAIAAGVLCVSESSGIRIRDIRRICVSGAFGRYLDTKSAIEVGLIPDVPSGTVELCSNAALIGCALMLLDPGSAGTLESLRGKTVFLNMAQTPEFEELFIENLFLRPFQG